MSQISDLIKERIENLRPKLQDTSKRNPLINNAVTAKSKSFLSIVDEKPQEIYFGLCKSDDASMQLVSLPPTDIDPPDEDTSEFRSAFQAAQITNKDYIETVEQIDFEHDDDAPNKLEDANRKLKDLIRELLEMPKRPSNSEKLSDLVNHAKAHGINPSITLPQPYDTAEDGRHTDDKLQTLLLPKTFQSRMYWIASKAREYREERGLDVVYLVIGYLKWTLPNDEKENEFKSPLLLIPVSLEKKKSREGEIYSISRLGDPIFNPSLAHKLKAEAYVDISAPIKLAQSETIDVEGFLKEVETLRPKNMLWTVQREASFGIYPFQGIELYYDLATEECDFSKFPIVSEIMAGRAGDVGSNRLNFDETNVESEQARELVPHLVLDADSSQFIALLKVANCENVALEGPPGSGKSQTIVNAIANAIYMRKKVIFVAQKVTALEVVQSRMKSLGLDKFVLPLMGDFGSSKKFYAALRERIELSVPQSSADLERLKRGYIEQRDKIAKYLDVISRPVPHTKMSVHQVLGLKVAYNERLAKLPSSLRSVDICLERFNSGIVPKDLDDLADKIASSFLRLNESSDSEDGVWVDLNLDKIDVNLINSILVNSRYLLSQFNAAVEALGRTPQKVFSDFLKYNYSIIKNEYASAREDRVINSLHDLIVRFGESEFRSAYEWYEAAESVYKSETLDSDMVSRLMGLEAPLRVTSGFVQDGYIDRIEKGGVDRVLHLLDIRVNKLSEILSYRAEIDERLCALLSPKSIVQCMPFISQRDAIEPLIRVINVLGVTGVEDELRSALKVYRSTSHFCRADDLPSPQLISRVLDVIKSAGIFSFFSSEYSRAKERAVAWLKDLSPSDSKGCFIDGLEKLLEQSREYYGLEISEVFGTLNKSSVLRIRVALSECLVVAKEVSAAVGVDVLSVLQVVDVEKIDRLIEAIKEEGIEDYSWEQVSTIWGDCKASRLTIKSSITELKAVEDYFTFYKFDSLRMLPVLEDLSVKAASCFSNSIEFLSSFMQFIGVGGQNQESITSLLARYSEMSTLTKYILFDDEARDIRDTIFQQLSNIESIVQSAIALRTAKGCAAIEVQNQSIAGHISYLERHINDSSGFSQCVSRKNTYQEADDCGLLPLLLRLKGCANESSVRLLSKLSVISRLVHIVERDFGASLLGFDGQTLADARASLQKYDKLIIELSPKEVASRALNIAAPPSGITYGRKSELTEMALLKHELGKTRRSHPRKIIKRALNSLVELFPCWMMVPSAVPQYLPRDCMFDLVIIDEASQMTPENSISALVRGKYAFIAGDTNQLPPTSFFKSLSSDDDEDEDISIPEESILELANLQFQPKHRLLWHYRSRHEDLIAFSNHYVYDSELVIFPSPNPTTRELGISLVQVNGTYQRGVNPAEAQVMVDAIVHFMKETPNRSLGVAVMNISQMELVESLVLRQANVIQAVADYLDYWEHANQGLEKFFVKNLENVQGDERDVIFVGLVYGRDPQGRFYQRFSTINGPAGKRRLNVLFTRAKQQIVTFSSIPLGDFAPLATNEGATLLKRWLEFSATKRLGEVAHSHDRAGYADSPFEEHVIETVRSLGYEAVPQVGVSSYFIDIGVKHSTYPYGYICGIECDGASYHSSKSARDRDRLREEVLTRLGWDLYRIWSTDWFQDALACRELLKQYLEERLALLQRSAPRDFVPETVIDHESSSAILEPVGLLAEEQVGYGVSHSQANLTASCLGETCLSKNFEEKSGPEITIGTKFSLRYLDGPRAGALVKFFYQRRTNDPAYRLDGYTVLGPDSPLGAALETAAGKAGDVVTYSLAGQGIRVQIVNIEPS